MKQFFNYLYALLDYLSFPISLMFKPTTSDRHPSYQLGKTPCLRDEPLPLRIDHNEGISFLSNPLKEV